MTCSMFLNKSSQSSKPVLNALQGERCGHCISLLISFVFYELYVNFFCPGEDLVWTISGFGDLQKSVFCAGEAN